MLKNITASALTALCILAVSASAGAQGVVDGVAGAAEDIVNGVGDAGRDIADGLMGTDAGDPGLTSDDSDVNSSNADNGSKDGSDPLDDPTESENSDDSDDPDDSDDASSDTVIGGANGDNPNTGISFGYIAGAAVLGALGVAVTVNKRRS